MPNIAQFRRPSPQPLVLFDTRRPTRPADAAMIAQVITHADRAERLSGGRLRLRISHVAIEALQAQGRLMPGDERLADLSVTWDETEGQVIQVRDDARLRDASTRWAEWDSLWDEESYRSDLGMRQAAA